MSDADFIAAGSPGAGSAAGAFVRSRYGGWVPRNHPDALPDDPATNQTPNPLGPLGQNPDGTVSHQPPPGGPVEGPAMPLGPLGQNPDGTISHQPPSTGPTMGQPIDLGPLVQNPDGTIGHQPGPFMAPAMPVNGTLGSLAAPASVSMQMGTGPMGAPMAMGAGVSPQPAGTLGNMGAAPAVMPGFAGPSFAPPGPAPGPTDPNDPTGTLGGLRRRRAQWNYGNQSQAQPNWGAPRAGGWPMPRVPTS